MHKNILTVVGITILFLGTCITPTIAIDNVNNSSMPISNGNTLYVGGSGPGNYSKIQDAIDDAVDGDTVFVYNGLYYERVTIDKSITLIGEDKNITIIDAGGTGDVVNIIADNVYISGFKIGNCGSIYPYNDAGISISSHVNTLTDNILTFNNANGIFLSNSNNNFIKGNIITLNDRVGIKLIKSKFNIIENNIITINKKHGITFESSNKNIIKDNTITSNKQIGIAFVSSTSNTIERNNISFNNDGGIYLGHSIFNTFKHNKIYNNEDGIRLRASKFNTISNNNICMNNYSGITISYAIRWIYPDGVILPSRLNSVKVNNISNNRKYGIYIEQSHLNFINKNNFFKNGKDAFFEKTYNNRWKRNYWSEPRVLPKPIIGRIWYDGDEIQTWILMVNIDWRPAKEPYEIGV